MHVRNLLEIKNYYMNCAGKLKLMFTVFTIVSLKYSSQSLKQDSMERNENSNLTMEYPLRDDLRMVFATNL